jgi:hypothetical protein
MPVEVYETHVSEPSACLKWTVLLGFARLVPEAPRHAASVLIRPDTQAPCGRARIAPLARMQPLID